MIAIECSIIVMTKLSSFNTLITSDEWMKCLPLKTISDSGRLNDRVPIRWHGGNISPKYVLIFVSTWLIYLRQQIQNNSQQSYTICIFLLDTGVTSSHTGRISKNHIFAQTNTFPPVAAWKAAFVTFWWAQKLKDHWKALGCHCPVFVFVFGNKSNCPHEVIQHRDRILQSGNSRVNLGYPSKRLVYFKCHMNFILKHRIFKLMPLSDIGFLALCSTKEMKPGVWWFQQSNNWKVPRLWRQEHVHQWHAVRFMWWGTDVISLMYKHEPYGVAYSTIWLSVIVIVWNFISSFFHTNWAMEKST